MRFSNGIRGAFLAARGFSSTRPRFPAVAERSVRSVRSDRTGRSLRSLRAGFSARSAYALSSHFFGVGASLRSKRPPPSRRGLKLPSRFPRSFERLRLPGLRSLRDGFSGSTAIGIPDGVCAPVISASFGSPGRT